jgi:hypothetical protein
MRPVAVRRVFEKNGFWCGAVQYRLATLAETVEHMQLVMGGGQSDRANPSWDIPPSPFGRGHRLTAVVWGAMAGCRSKCAKGLMQRCCDELKRDDNP